LSVNDLKKSITLVQGAALAIGSVLGSGILVLPSITAEIAGPAAILSWIIMSILSLPLAITLGRLASKYPDASGVAAYAQEAFGVTAGKLTGWLFVGTLPLAAPVTALVGANYMGSIMHLTNWQITGIAATMVLTSIMINARGIEMASWMQALLVTFILILLVAAIIAAAPHVQSGAYRPFFTKGFSSVLTASMMIFWSFAGWELVTPLVEEFRNPRRDIILSLTFGAIIISILYIAIEIVIIGTRAYGPGAGLVPISILVGKGFGHIAYYFTAFLALIITFGTTHVNIAGFSRIVYGQARKGDFPRAFSKLHSTYKTPIIVLIGLALVFILVLVINGFFKPNLGTFMKWVSVVDLVQYMIAMSAALKLLSPSDIGWWMASVPLVVCIILYPFSGWATIYPLILLMTGWLFYQPFPKKKRNLS
jgi:amino acid efflux transporter